MPNSTVIETERAYVLTALCKTTGRTLDEIDESEPLAEFIPESFALVETIITLQEALGVILLQDDLLPVRNVGDLVDVLVEKLPTKRKKAERNPRTVEMIR